MPAFLVELPESQTVSNLFRGATALVVFAADEAGARTAAEGYADGDGNALWSSEASVTQIVTTTALADSGSGWTLYARISSGAAQTVDPIVVEVDGLTKDQAQGVLGKTRLHISETIVINDGGASNVDDDVYTLVGGTFTRAATFIATGTGAITSFELSDPGEYSELPTLTNATFTTTGSGTGEDIDLVQADVGGYEALVAQMVTDLTAAADITAASVDLAETGAGARIFTLAEIADNIGDATVEFEFRHNGTEEPVLLSTVVDEGIAGAVLTVAIPASPLAPPRITPFAATSQ